jgi:dihydroorotate dehydrogenase
MTLYRHLARPVLFRFGAESAHRLALAALRLTHPALIRTFFGRPHLGPPVEVFGIRFPNAVGLAAGMDKDAVALPAWEAMGFGFVEIGTITAHPQPGNPRPRLFRYPSERALINRMGFNNGGAAAVARRLARQRATPRWPRIPVGINLGKSKITPLEKAPEDYATSFRLLRPFGDYFVINVSSPNTPGLRQLQDRSALAGIIRALKAIDADAPLLVKVAPDLTDDQLRDVALLAAEEGLAGLIATNTTLDHSAVKEGDQPGGLSGEPLRGRATQAVRILREAGSLPVIASGGVMGAGSAREKFAAGASLVQLYTGFVYDGPDLITTANTARFDEPFPWVYAG